MQNINKPNFKKNNKSLNSSDWACPSKQTRIIVLFQMGFMGARINPDPEYVFDPDSPLPRPTVPMGKRGVGESKGRRNGGRAAALGVGHKVRA